jgi:putative spermidine/putrescine transport system ATP-binding protein
LEEKRVYSQPRGGRAMSFVRIENVSKQYGQLKVLNNIALSVEEGEFVTLLGPSGCGKSTLLRAIAGLNDIDSGALYVGDEEITYLSPKDRHVGMVFQSYALFPNMNVFNNIAFGLKMEGMKKGEYTKRVEEMIELIDLKGKENHHPHQLSGGQQQRVALARALVKRPKILLLDEPLSALDAKIRRTLRNEIRQIQQRLKMTTVFVTHDQEEALTISDRIFVMNHGNIEQEGTPEQIYTSPRTEFVARFIGNYNVLSKDQLATAELADLTNADMIAIRPEAIHIGLSSEQENDSEGYASFIGRVRQSTVLGNIIRFEVEVNGLQLTIDKLYDVNILRIKADSSVRIAIAKKECIQLQKTV